CDRPTEVIAFFMRRDCRGGQHFAGEESTRPVESKKERGEDSLLGKSTTTIRSSKKRSTHPTATSSPEFSTIRPTTAKMASNLYSHNSATNATTIRPVTNNLDVDLLHLLANVPMHHTATIAV